MKISNTLMTILLVFIPHTLIAQGILEEIVVTAQKREENLQSVPISITTLSGEALRDLGVSQARQIAEVTPNLQWKGDSNILGNTIHIRGIGTNSTGGEAVPAVGVYFDEISINNTYALGLFLYDVERLDVLRGPQGTLYGRNTTGGAVNIVSRTPEVGGGVQGDLHLGYGNFNSVDFEGGLGFDLTDNLSARISGMYKNRDGLVDNTFLGNDARSLDVYSLRGQLAFEPTDSFDAILSVQYSEVDNDQNLFKSQGLLDPATFGPCATPENLGTCSDFFGYVDSSDFHDNQSDFSPEEYAESYMVSLRANWDIGPVTVTSVTGYFDFDRPGARTSQDVDATPFDILNTAFGSPSDQFSQELRITSNTDGNLSWVVGLYYFTEDLSSPVTIAARGYGPGFISGGPNLEGVWTTFEQDTETFAIFGQTTWDLTDKISLTGGLRWTWEDKETLNSSYTINVDSLPTVVDPGSNLFPFVIFPFFENVEDSQDTSEPSWRMALDYTVTENILLYASITRGFKAGIGNSAAVFDPAEAGLVEPEFVTAYETGIKSDVLDWLRINASGFYYDFTDQQVSVFVFGTEQLDNAAESTVYGAEFEVVAQPNENLFISLGIGLLDTEFDEYDGGALGDFSGNELPAAPSVNLNGLVRYEHPVGTGRVGTQFSFTHMDSQFFTNANNPLLAQDSYWLLNARLGYRFMDDKFEIAGWIRNLADEDYLVEGFDNADFTGANLLLTGTPRTYGIELNYNF